MANSLGDRQRGAALDSPSGVVEERDLLPIGKDSPPIVWLARIGAVILVFQIYVYARWIFSDEFYRVPPGPDPVPTTTFWIIKVAEVICVVGTIACIVYLWRKTKETGKFPTIGVFLFAWLLSAWQDVGVNAIRPVFAYNTEFVQMGTWASFIPGWVEKGPDTPAPIIYTIGDYFVFFPLAILGIDALVRRMRKRWPRINRFGIVVGLLVFFFVVDTTAEQILQRQKLWTYFRVNDTWSIFTGTLNQFPMYEGVFFGAVVMVAGICLYIFRRKDGGLISDAGIERLKINRGVGFVRILAMTTVINAIMLVFNLGFNFANQHANTLAPDVPSYLHVNMCGVNDNPACPPPE